MPFLLNLRSVILRRDKYQRRENLRATRQSIPPVKERAEHSLATSPTIRLYQARLARMHYIRRRYSVRVFFYPRALKHTRDLSQTKPARARARANERDSIPASRENIQRGCPRSLARTRREIREMSLRYMRSCTCTRSPRTGPLFLRHAVYR